MEARPLTPLAPMRPLFATRAARQGPHSNSHTDQFAIAGGRQHVPALQGQFPRPNDPDLMDNSGGQDGFSRPDFFYNAIAPNGRTFAQGGRRS